MTERQGGWQPIDTAPKDGTRILFFGKWLPYDINPGGQPCVAIASWSTFQSNGTGYQWIVDCCLGPCGDDSMNVDFTHWQPLPSPPKEDQT